MALSFILDESGNHNDKKWRDSVRVLNKKIKKIKDVILLITNQNILIHNMHTQDVVNVS